MVTDSRPDFVKKSVEMFRKQTYANKHLVILAYIGDDYKEYLNDNDVTVMYYGDTHRRRLVRLRNMSMEYAKLIEGVTHIALWDDDDIQGDMRLEVQIDGLITSNRKLSIMTRFKIQHDNAIYLVEYLLCSPTILFDVELLNAGKKLAVFTQNGYGELDCFIYDALRLNLMVGINGANLYTMVYHDKNTIPISVKSSILSESKLLN